MMRKYSIAAKGASACAFNSTESKRVTTGFGSETTFSIGPGLEVTSVPDGAMVYQAATDKVHYLNPTATIIFELCGMGKNVAEIEAFIADGFALADAPTAQVAECLASLTEQGLIAANS